MPDFPLDTNIKVRKVSPLLVPAGGQVGTALRKLSDRDYDIGWADEATEDLVLRGSGDPNGLVTAPQGALYIDRVVPALWQNTDGMSAWEAVGGGAATALVFAKQMYGTVNDPGGGAPTDPWGQKYGGIFDEGIADPSSDDGGWISYQLENKQYVAVTRGLDPRADYGYLDEEFYNDNTFDPGGSSGWYFDYEVYLGLSYGGGPPWPLVSDVLGMMNLQADVDDEDHGTVQWFITAEGSDSGSNDLTISADVVGKASPSGGYYQLEGGWGSRFRIKVASTQTRNAAFYIYQDDTSTGVFKIREGGQLGLVTETHVALTPTTTYVPVYDPETDTLVGYLPIYT